MATFDLSGHPLLSPAAKVLAAGAATTFTAQVEAAELLITAASTTATRPGVDWGHLPSGTDDLAKLALAYQVNHQLATDYDAHVLKRQEEGEVSKQFRDDIPAVPQSVLQLLPSLIPTQTPTVTLRTSRTAAVASDIY